MDMQEQMGMPLTSESVRNGTAADVSGTARRPYLVMPPAGAANEE